MKSDAHRDELSRQLLSAARVGPSKRFPALSSGPTVPVCVYALTQNFFVPFFVPPLNFGASTPGRVTSNNCATSFAPVSSVQPAIAIPLPSALRTWPHCLSCISRCFVCRRIQNARAQVRPTISSSHHSNRQVEQPRTGESSEFSNLINYSQVMASLVGVFRSLVFEEDLASATLLNQAVVKLPPNFKEAWCKFTVKSVVYSGCKISQRLTTACTA